MAIGGLMDTSNVPSQLDEEDLRAEVELEVTDSGADPYLMSSDLDSEGLEIEIIEEDNGDVTVDFDPSASLDDMEGGFSDNLAEYLSDYELSRISSDLSSEFDSNKASRQEWEDTYSMA